ncbi:hypothetical protein HDU98_002330 [Podochytrium sp. JEL0797]|nr:hypothetical protein HDU98_002330 [Podochytrium sp. JEL0797]
MLVNLFTLAFIASSVPATPVPARATTLTQLWGTTGSNYPTVFLHGLGGWGEAKPLLGLVHYFGGITQNILQDLRDNGYTVSAPSMGPLSSNWERACEAFAQITGSVTDYGVARSTQFGHLRFGEDHTGDALVPGFMQASNPLKINLVGHSLGGPTQRMLTHLLQFGSPTEMSACVTAKTVCSPLFWTNKTQSYVNGVYALSGVHQGSTFADFLQSNNGFLDFFRQLILTVVGLNNWDGINLLDMQLGHWGLVQNPGEKFFAYMNRILASPWFFEDSNALFDLSVSSVNSPLLSFVQNAPQVTYFSTAGLSTNWVINVALAQVTTLVFLGPIAGIIGTYSNSSLPILTSTNTPKGWRMNDGLVPIASSRSPPSGFKSFPMSMSSGSQTSLVGSALAMAPAKGVYNYVGEMNHMDHADLVGLLDLVPGMRTNLYMNIMSVLNALNA